MEKYFCECCKEEFSPDMADRAADRVSGYFCSECASDYDYCNMCDGIYASCDLVCGTCEDCETLAMACCEECGCEYFGGECSC